MLTPLPVVLQTDRVLFPTTTPLGAYGASPAMLRNYDDRGVLIDKILITAREAASGVPNRYASQGVSIRLRWRNEPITNGFVPAVAVSYPRNRYFEHTTVIHLAKPFYLPPNDFVSVEYRWDLTFPGPAPVPGGFNAAVYLQTYGIGRQSLPPAQRFMPYLTAMIGNAVNGEIAATYEQQSETLDLGNPFDRPLHVERLIGRLLACGNVGTDFVNDLGPNPIWSLFRARIWDDRENIWVPTPTPLPSVFDLVDRSWLVGVTLPPKSYLTASIEKDVSTWNPASYARYQRAVIGLVGYRQIDSKE